MELIIVSILFVALMACWIILPGQGSHASATVSAEPLPAAAPQRLG
jgi:hypothetical protein